MKEASFVKWGTYKTSGKLRICDPCELKIFNAKKCNGIGLITIPRGEYEFLACSAHEEYKSGGSCSGLLGIVLKKPSAELNFSKLKRIKGKFLETTKKISLLEEKTFNKINDKKAEEICWAPLARSKSKLLVGEEKEQDPWWIELAIKKDYICSNGMAHSGEFYLYQSPGVLAIFFWPLDADFSKLTIHKKKQDLNVFRAKVIKKTLFHRISLAMDMKFHAKCPKE
jgi:hypothetical protein